MKRGKEDEKAIGPMFPRLHVNDTEKKGPKAPPRNKMALYEQLSIPSQRFSHGSVNLEPPSSQGFKNERGMFSPYQLPTRPHSDKQYSQYSDLSSPMTQVEQRKKLEDNDFRVPIFVQPTPSQECGDYTSEKISTSNPYSNRPSKFRKAKNTSMLESITREGESHEGESSKEVTTDQLEVVSNSLTIETTNGLNKQSDSQRENIALLEKRNSSTSVRDFPSEGLSDDTESHYKSCRSPQTRDLEGVDSLSETSVMDSVSRVDVTPDDVVGIIGQKQFWKARRAIVNQQRVFAVQVFELHRLMKVQKSIAASPHLLLEDSAYLGKPTKNSSAIPLIYSIKAIPNVSKQKSDELEKPTHRKEGSAENIGRRESFSSVQNVVQRSSCRPMSGTSPVPSSISSNNNARPCCFNQPQGVHWLIPVMSPSEGLVYKPYPGPAFVSPAGVGGGSLGSKLLSDSSYPSPHPPYQLPAFPPAAPHAYFPPYSMPVMNAAAFSGSSVEQMNTAPSIPSQVSVPESNGSIRHENLPTAPNHKNQAFVDGLNDSLVSEDIEVRASTTTTSQLRDSRASCVVERRNVLPLFPTAPAIDTPNPSPRPWPPKPDRLQVIKVIPHNARSATESAAKIFQSIQEERKQYDKL